MLLGYYVYDAWVLLSEWLTHVGFKIVRELKLVSTRQDIYD